MVHIEVTSSVFVLTNLPSILHDKWKGEGEGEGEMGREKGVGRNSVPFSSGVVLIQWLFFSDCHSGQMVTLDIGYTNTSHTRLVMRADGRRVNLISAAVTVLCTAVCSCETVCHVRWCVMCGRLCGSV